MPVLTTGINTATQAAEILAALRTHLVPAGVSITTRGRLWDKPPFPFAVLAAVILLTIAVSMVYAFGGAS